MTRDPRPADDGDTTISGGRVASPPPGWPHPDVPSRIPGDPHAAASPARPPAAHPPSGAVPGPPPPPAEVGGEGEARATAATWVAAVGALLLLAAAGTFLAVSWDALGLTARIAIVAAGTGAAILGGLRMRAQLPAVGAVVFHLGALLVPVDALGLALQLDADVAVRWLAVGATALLVLPPLAVAGRSRALGWAALAGIPVLATGVGLASGVAAPLSVALAALALVAVAPRRQGGGDAPRAPLAPVRRAGGAVLALVAVHGPLLAAVVAALPTFTGSGRQAVDAGWVPSDWSTTAVWGVLAVVALVVVAARARSSVLASTSLVSAGVAATTTLLPSGTPRVAVLLGVPLIALVVEVTAWLVRDDELWGRALRGVALVVELLAVPVALGVAVVALDPSVHGARTDAELAASLAVASVAWLVAAGRRLGSAGPVAAAAPVLLGVSVLHLVVAGHLVGVLPDLLGPGVALAAVTLLAWTELGRRDGVVEVAAAHAAAVVSVGLLVVGAATTHAAVATLGVLVVAVTVLAAHLDAAIASRRGGYQALTWVLLPVAWVAAAAALPVVSDGGAAIRIAGLMAALLGLWLLAATTDRLEGAGDATRVLLGLVGVVALLPVWPSPVLRAGGNVTGLDVVLRLGLLPTAVVPALLAAVLLVVDLVRTRRVIVSVVLAPVLVRLLVAGLLASGLDVTATAIVVLGTAVVVGAIATLGAAWWRPATLTFAVLGGVVGLLLVGDARLVRAGLVIAVGGLLVLTGLARGRAAIAHVGGIVGIVGIWDLLGALQVTALDLWVLPVAAHLWLAGLSARRADGLRSSWVVDVPPLLLVVIPAMAERMSGGPGWHALLAGGVALAAVVYGGSGRHAGPLVVGTVALVAVVLVETFAVVAAVPTWAWLALGGAALLGAAVVIERTGGNPVRSVRRLVEVVSQRFD